MGRRVMAVLAAVVVGLIGVGSVMIYASAADSRAVAGQRLQTVFVAAKLVPSGTSAADAVAQGLIVSTRAAAQGVPAGALGTVNNATGKLLALSAIAPGEYVLASRFGSTPLGQQAIQVPSGQVAVSVSLPEPARVGTFVTPGSHIVIYDTYGQDPNKQTLVLLKDVLVIAVGSTSLAAPSPASGQAAAPAAASSVLVTVALAPNSATRLVHAAQTGSCYASLQGTNATASLGQVVTNATLPTK
jgi:pilus assembly protein CpaB